MLGILSWVAKLSSFYEFPQNILNTKYSKEFSEQKTHIGIIFRKSLAEYQKVAKLLILLLPIFIYTPVLVVTELNKFMPHLGVIFTCICLIIYMGPTGLYFVRSNHVYMYNKVLYFSLLIVLITSITIVFISKNQSLIFIVLSIFPYFQALIYTLILRIIMKKMELK